MARTLYLRRPLENAADLIKWAKGQGFSRALTPDQMHVTIGYSKAEVEWPEPHEDQIIVNKQSGRVITPLGDGGAVVLRFESTGLEARWKELLDAGASWDFPAYKPHVTITWDVGDIDVSKIKPYTGPLVFGPEIMSEIDPNAKDKMTEKVGSRHTRREWQLIQQIHDAAMALGADCDYDEDEPVTASVMKVDDELGVVFGWAIISTVKGEPYFDLQGDYIPDHSMMKATTEFMESSRVGKIMHAGPQTGTIVHSLPLTDELAKAFKIKVNKTGWIVGYKPYDKRLLEKFRSGEYTGFSIGGARLVDEEID